MPAGADRVLLVAHALTPWQMQLWAEVAKSVDLHVVGASNAPNTDQFPRTEQVPSFAEVHQLTARGVLKRGHTWWFYQGLGRLIGQLAPDLVHVSSEPWGFLSQQALAAKRPFTLHATENIWDQGGTVEATMRAVMTRRALKRAAGLASWNAEAVSLAHGYGLPSARPTLVCPFAVSPAGPYREQRPRVWGARDSAAPLVVGYAGRVVDFKGLDWLVDGVALARSQGTAARLVVVGSGPHSDAVAERARAAGVPCELLGALPTEELPGVLGGWDLAVVPSLTTPTWKEQFGRAAVEAMMCGLPVIVSNTGALPEVVGDAGIVLDENDVPGLAASITALAPRDARVARGRACAERFDTTYAADVLSEKMLTFWSRALDRPTRLVAEGPMVESPVAGSPVAESPLPG